MQTYVSTRDPHKMLLLRVWELRHNLSAYDAAYVALSERIGAPVITRDSQLAAAVGHSALVGLL